MLIKRFAVFGLGNTSYPKFCAFAKIIDTLLTDLKAESICEIGLGDELSGQEESFRKWSNDVYNVIIDYLKNIILNSKNILSYFYVFRKQLILFLSI